MTKPSIQSQQFPCQQCGADLAFEPGTQVQKCPYCGHENHIAPSSQAIEELDYEAYLASLRRIKARGEDATHVEDRVVHCNTCGADISLAAHTTADACAYCGSSVVIQETKRVIKPRSLLAFSIKAIAAKGLFKKWLASRWFAPGDLAKRTLADSGLQGVYVPYWTYDSHTTTHYRGERGENYYETQTYTEVVDGKVVQRTRQVVRTRWYPARGTVRRFFDDVLVLGSRTLPRKFTERLEPWDLEQLVAYDDKYLSGFRAEKYQVGLEQGFANAHQIMEGQLRADVRRDIGGDQQRIHTMDIGHRGVTFKHLLLPVWISAYRYREKVYRFLVNGRTGEVQGERPYSWVKILFASLVGIALVSGAIYWSQVSGG